MTAPADPTTPPVPRQRGPLRIGPQGVDDLDDMERYEPEDDEHRALASYEHHIGF